MAIDRELAKSFSKFLQAGGAEVLETKNSWELSRFKTINGTLVVYQNSKGKTSYSDEHARKAFDAFKNSRKWTANHISGRVHRKSVEQQIIERDGSKCFFCEQLFTGDSPPTLEHLLSISDGGNNHLSNLALAHKECNTAAASLSIVEKVKLREKRRYG